MPFGMPLSVGCTWTDLDAISASSLTAAAFAWRSVHLPRAVLPALDGVFVSFSAAPFLTRWGVRLLTMTAEAKRSGQRSAPRQTSQACLLSFSCARCLCSSRGLRRVRVAG